MVEPDKTSVYENVDGQTVGYTNHDQIDTFGSSDQVFMECVQPKTYDEYTTSDPEAPEGTTQVFMEVLSERFDVGVLTWDKAPPPVQFDLPQEVWIGLQGLGIQLNWDLGSKPTGSIEALTAGPDDLGQFQRAKAARDRLKHGIEAALFEETELLTEIDKLDQTLIVFPKLVEEEGDREILVSRAGGFTGQLNVYGKRPRPPTWSAWLSSNARTRLASPRLSSSGCSHVDPPVSFSLDTDTNSIMLMNGSLIEGEDGNEVPPLASGLLGPLSEHRPDDELQIVELIEGGEIGKTCHNE